MYDDSSVDCTCLDCETERKLVLEFEREFGVEDPRVEICPTHYEPECKDCAAGEGYDC